jgi:hypothetical protein
MGAGYSSVMRGTGQPNEDGPFHDRHGVFPNMVKQLQRRMVKGRLSGLVKSGE